MRQINLLVLSLAIVIGGLLLPAQPVVYAEADAPLDTPTTVVFSGVTRFTVTPPKLFWYTGVPSCPPT